MKSVDCNVIKDLLPSYIDKLLSKESNNLVEEHMQTCKECRKVLTDMSKEKGIEKVFNQDEKIDYLKRYRKKKILSIIIAVLITIFAIFDIFCIGSKFLFNHEFYMNVNDVKLTYRGEGEFRGNKILDYIMNSSSKFLIPFCLYDDISKDTENGIVYLIDGKNNKIKIWDKEQGALTKKYPTVK